MAELAETAPTSRERSLRVMSSGVQGFLQTAGSRVQRQKSQKRMVRAEIPHLGIPEQRVLIKPRGQKRPRAPSATMTRLRRWQRPAAGNGSQDDCSRAHVCVSCLTAQLEPHGRDISTSFRTDMDTSRRSGQPCVFPNLRGKVSSLSKLTTMSAASFS